MKRIVDITTNEQLVFLIKNHENEEKNMLQLYNQNKGFIYKMAMKFQNYAELDDLLQEGYLGLCEAVNHYKHGEALFITYAAFWIKQFMQRYISNCCNSIRVPVYALNEVFQYKRIVSDYRKYYGKEPTDREMRAFLYVSQEKLEDIKKNALTVNTRSLSEPIGGEEEGIMLSDMVASSEDMEEDIIKRLDTAAMKESLWQAVDELSDNMPEVLRHRYQNKMTMKEVGESMGISAERARQEEAKALRKLRIPSRSASFRGYYEQYLAPAQFHHVGLSEFRRTWTSSVEEAVLGL